MNNTHTPVYYLSENPDRDRIQVCDEEDTVIAVFTQREHAVQFVLLVLKGRVKW